MNILHLSDLHFGTHTNATNWYSQLADDLTYELNCLSIDLLILSGDIANKSNPNEYSAAEKFTRVLSQDFHIHPDNIVIVPGNHDVNWTLAKKSYSLKRREEYKGPVDEKGVPDQAFSIAKGEFVEVLNENKYKQRHKHFCEFYKAITGKQYPLDYSEQGILYHYPDYKLLVLGLNSAWQLDHHYRARAGVHSDAVSNALNKVRQQPEIFGQCLKFAVWHHPLNGSGDDRITEHGFLQRLAQSGFILGFHGHIHKAENDLFRYDRSIGGRKIEIISAGTFGAPIREWVPGYPLQYNFIRLEEKKIIVETRARTELNGAWKPDAIWTQGPGKDPLPRYEIVLPDYTTTTRYQTTSDFISTLTTPVMQAKSDILESDSFKIPNEATIPVKKVLIVAVCPTDTPRLRLEKEVREISNALWQARKVKFIVEIRWAVRVQDLSRALLEFEPQIIHFCGHGSRDGGVLLEDESGHSHMVSPEALAGLFELFSENLESVVESVFFNACYTEKQADAIAPYVNYIFGTQSAIADDDAILFSSAFYEALANGRSFEFAFEYAQRVTKANGTVADIKPFIKSSIHLVKRSLGNNTSLPEKRQIAFKRILFLAASPKDTNRLRLDEEIREILNVLSRMIQSGDIIIQQRWGARFEDLHQALLEFHPDIVHFSGHGIKEGLIFEDEIGKSHLVGLESILKLFELFANRIDCVLLNAPWSDNIAKELSKYVNYSIGMSEPGSDTGAIAFAVGFYRALGARTSMEEAFKSGCIQCGQRTEQKEIFYSFNKRANHQNKTG